MGKVCGSCVQVATVSGQLLCSYGQQLLGAALFGIGGTTEGIKIHNSPSCQMGAEVFPLAHIVAQVTGNKTGLEQTVQLKAYLISPRSGAAVEVVLVT